MSSSVFDQRSRNSDEAKAAQYHQIADLMAADKYAFHELLAGVTDDARYGTFAKAYADMLRRDYSRFVADIAEAERQAREIAGDYAAHADGSYEPLRPS